MTNKKNSTAIGGSPNSTLSSTNPTKDIQAYLESGVIPLDDLAETWDKEGRKFLNLVSRVASHFNITSVQRISINLNVRDAMQNMALTGMFLRRSITVGRAAHQTTLSFVTEWQADALLRQIDGRSLSETQKRWLRSVADELRNAIAESHYPSEPRSVSLLHDRPFAGGQCQAQCSSCGESVIVPLRGAEITCPKCGSRMRY